MEELSERAKIMLVFDSYLQKTGYNLPELRENYKEIESILKIATKLGGGEEKNLSHRIDITMATDYAVFIYLKKEDSPDTQYRLIRFKETIKDVKERLNPEEVIQIYANSEIIVKHYEKQIRKINAERKKTKRKNKPVQIIQNFPENDKPKKNKPLISEKTYENGISENMIEKLRNLSKDIDEHPEKYTNKIKYKKYFKGLIKQYQKNLCEENITSLSLQEKNDAKFANNIEKLIHNMLRGWSGAKQELNEIKKEFDSEFYYDPARLIEYLGKEMIILKIITKDELPESMQ